MELSISPVETEDVDLLVRRVEFPAHQDNPLYRLMFPRSTEQHWEQREDEIRWSIDGLLETVHQEDEALYKAYGEDGSPVGLIGWTTSPGAFAKGMSRDCTHGGPVVKSGAREVGKLKIRNSFTPPSLDVTSWLGISKRLREERQRVIRGYPGNGIFRKPSVNLNFLGPCSLTSIRNHFHGCGSKSSTSRCWVYAHEDFL